MPQQDTTELKNKILRILRLKGPSLPVHVAKETGLSILFASAFLSELVADKSVKISNMKVGSSPIYFIPDQAEKLTKFSEYLKSKEKDAYMLLKEKKFLTDVNQEPAIRIALRSIKDFAIPFEKKGALIWRFFTFSESDYEEPKRKIEKPQTESMVPQATKLKLKQDSENIDKKTTINSTPPLKKKKTTTKQDKFFNSVKIHLNKKNIAISDFIGFSKTDLTLIVEKNGKKLLVAFNKKKITETDLLKVYKKSQEFGLDYIILALGEQTKKINTIINAIKSLDSLEKIE